MITQMWMEKVKNAQILTPARMIAMDAIKPFLVVKIFKNKTRYLYFTSLSN